MKFLTLSNLKCLSILFLICGTSYATDNMIKVELIPTEKTPATNEAKTDEKQKNSIIEFVTLKNNSIKIKGEIKGLTPGPHGFHIHENANCSDPKEGFKKSGGHFNPNGKHHGTLMSGHVGDLGNIIADKNGVAHINIVTNKFNLIAGDKFNIHNRALVVHAGNDDEKSDPAGNSGDRIFCGVIQ